MIDKAYILFTRVPFFKDSQGRLYCDPLWAKDLHYHLDYISQFGMCCPVHLTDNIEGLTDISHYNISPLIELKPDEGLASIIKNILPNFKRVFQACKQADIVHSGGAGWAFPLSFYILFLRPFLTVKWVMVIESSFWMLEKSEKPTFRRFVEHHTHNILLTCAVKKADARIFTQSFYQQYFLGDNRERAMINPATWVDKQWLLSKEQVKERHNKKIDEPLKVFFPARLLKDKGVYTLFEAINTLQTMDIALHITIMGVGDLAQQCEDFANNSTGPIQVSFKNPVDYGKAFFDELGAYDFVLVANLKQEQPRIIFDAFSQGVGVIAANTSGILDITNNNNAIIFKAGDSHSLVEAISHAVRQPDLALSTGLAGLEYAAGKTHAQMHLDRQQFLEKLL